MAQKKTVLFAVVALTTCICWAFTSALADQAASYRNAKIAAPNAKPVQVVAPSNSQPRVTTQNEQVPVSRKDRAYNQGRHITNGDWNILPFWPMDVRPELLEQAAAQRGGPPPSECTFAPCDVLIYENTGGNSIGQFGDSALGVPLCDDASLEGEERFICQITLGVGGISNSGNTVPVTFTLRSGNYFPICPDDPNSAVLYTEVRNLTLLQGSSLTFSFDPPLLLDDDFVWVCLASTDDDAGWNIAGPAETGFTNDNIVIINQNGTCEDLGPGQMDDYFWYGGDPIAGMNIQIFANDGPSGACCNRDADPVAICTDGVLRADCLVSLTSVWKPGLCTDFNLSNPPCNQCILQSNACTGAHIVDAEPNCADGYVDTYNNGCTENGLGTTNFNSVATGFPATSPTIICGTAGTYHSACTQAADCGGATPSCTGGICDGDEDSRDNDYWVLNLTSDTNVVATLTARFPAQMAIMDNGGDPANCVEDVDFVDFVQAPACEPTTITRCLPAGTWWIRVRPDTFQGVACDTRYRLELTAGASCSLPVAACCDNTGCTNLAQIACEGRRGQWLGDDAPPCLSCGDACASACPGVPVNDDCGSATALSGAAVSVAFNTSFATDSDLDYHAGAADVPSDCDFGAATAGHPIRSDVYFTYTIPTSVQGFAVSSGTIVISTAGLELFDPFVVVYGDAGSTAETGCGGLCSQAGGNVQLFCNDDIVNNGSTFALNQRSHLNLLVDNLSAGTELETGNCILIRVGRGQSAIVPSNPIGAAGQLNIDFIPSSTPWMQPLPGNTGRCCFYEESSGNTDCVVVRNINGDSQGLDDCLAAGGLMGPGWVSKQRIRADFYQGDTAVVEEVAGCEADPCPVAGEACYTAISVDFNGATPGGGSGTISRNIKDILYLKYEVPSSGGIVVDACGSTGFYDPAIAVYGGSPDDEGNCPLADLLAKNDDCEVVQSTADGALQAASCYGPFNGAAESCLCLGVGSDPFGRLDPGSIIYIQYGSWNEGQFAIETTNRDVLDPLPNNRENFVFANLTFTTVGSCFVCDGACPGGGAIAEGEVVCSESSDPGTVDNPGPQDIYNGGCFASPFSFNGPTIACSSTPVVICGKAGNFRHPNPCNAPEDCPTGEGCTGTGGSCLGDPFINRDTDWYKLTVTGPGTIRLRVTKAGFAPEIGIFGDPLGDCNAFTLALDDVTFFCEPPSGTPNTLEVTASVCGGEAEYYAYIAPSIFGSVGETDCNSAYVLEVTCLPFEQLAECCPGDLNNDGKVNGLDIDKWIDTLFIPPTVFDSFQGCFAANMCRADINESGVIDTTDLPLFVNLLVTASKPVCDSTHDCEDPTFGQPPGALETGEIGLVVSDLDNGSDGSGDYRAADCICPTENGVITQVCWWGGYVNVGGQECGPEKDCFQITFYNNNNGLGRCPGTRIEPPGSQFVGLTAQVNRVATGNSVSKTGNPADPLITEFMYTATLPTPLAVTAGQCLWVEIVNNTPVGSSNCYWHWEASPFGDTRHAEIDIDPATGSLPTVYSSCAAGTNIKSLDMAFSVNVRVNKEGCGKPLGRCCYDAVPLGVIDCEQTTQEICTAVRNGEWDETKTCADPQCVVGRCCYLTGITTNCVQTLKSTCDSLEGLWVAAPAACPCPTGKCCIGDACSVGVTEVKCIADGGRWLATGNCSTACPTAICDLAGSCQLPHVVSNVLQGGYVSDADNNSRVADDFRPNANGTIAQLCWRGFHSPIDCDGGEASSETFQINIYLASGLLPGALHAGPINVTPLKTDTGAASLSPLSSKVYRYEAVLSSPIAVTANTCYWLEITNTTVAPGCVWVWGTSDEGGNNRAAINPGGGYQNVDRDLSYCLGGPTGSPLSLNSAACSGNFTAPANDLCENRQIITAGVPVVGRTLGAANEGNASGGDGVGCGQSVSADVMYQFTTGPIDTSASFSVCGVNTTMDTVLSVHRVTATPCPARAGTQVTPTSASCNDNNGCVAALGTQQLFFAQQQSQVNLTAAQLIQNTQYIIRVAGRQSVGHPGGSKGVFTLTVSQPQGACCNGVTCTINTSAACTGTYKGDNTVCTPNPCP